MTCTGALAAALGFGLWALGCGGDGEALGTAGSGTDDASSSATGGETLVPLPCELASMFTERCGKCHGVEPNFGALRSLREHDDLIKSGDGFDTLAEACIARMKLPASDEESMPLSPRPIATDAEIALVQEFVFAGFPMGPADGSCE